MTNLNDRQAIAEIIARERASRDAEDWNELARCYTADSIVDLSWFHGTGAAFAEASAGMARTMFSFHELGTTVIDLNGDRALGDTGCTIHLIGELDGVEVDVLGYNRLRARVQREEDEWRMAGLRSVYIHDLIVPLNPSSPPRVAREDLEKYRRSYRCLCHMLVSHGLPARDDLPGVDKRETVAALVAAEKAWLHDARRPDPSYTAEGPRPRRRPR
jgi:hypothetical protein